MPNLTALALRTRHKIKTLEHSIWRQLCSTIASNSGRMTNVCNKWLLEWQLIFLIGKSKIENFRFWFAATPCKLLAGNLKNGLDRKPILLAFYQFWNRVRGYCTPDSCALRMKNYNQWLMSFLWMTWTTSETRWYTNTLKTLLYSAVPCKPAMILYGTHCHSQQNDYRNRAEGLGMMQNTIMGISNNSILKNGCL